MLPVKQPVNEVASRRRKRESEDGKCRHGALFIDQHLEIGLRTCQCHQENQPQESERINNHSQRVGCHR